MTIRKPDYDLKECLAICGIEVEMVKNVLAEVPGEADGPWWHAVLEMEDGTFAYLTGWCDYSGWGCQDGANIKITHTPIVAARSAKNDEYYKAKKSIKKQLLDQLTGKQPFGLREE